MTPAPKDSQMSLGTFSLWDIALTIAEIEAQEWGDEAAMNLFLEPSLTLVRHEAELIAVQCGQRTGERARVYVLAGKWSLALVEAAHYEHLARFADVWIFGAPDCDLSLNGVVAVPIPNGAALLDERGVVIESASFGAALFAHAEGLLNPADAASSYYEGFLTTHQEAVEAASGRLASLLRLAPMSGRWVDHDLVSGWYARMNRRIMEVLESERLQLRAREDEIAKIREESERMEKLVRGYVGGQTWDAARSALESNQEEIADLERQELTICFCDLVGFTKLSERLTPTQIAGILNDHFGRLYNIVRIHGGTIDKFIGDCMLAYFAEPVEAFEAAKKMVQESREVRPIADWTVPIQVRVGLNTGFVAVANLGVPEIRQRTILGEAVNFAQRMQSAAPPHSLLLSERTLARLPHTMIRNLEPLKVDIKGRRDPVQAYCWTISSERRQEMHSQMSLRGSLLKTGQRTSLADRLKRDG